MKPALISPNPATPAPSLSRWTSTSGARTQYTASNEVKLAPQWLPGGRISYAVRGTNAGLRIWHPDRRWSRSFPAPSGIPVGPLKALAWSTSESCSLPRTEHLLPTVSRDPEFELFLSEPFPAYSPDGKKLLYSQYGGNGTGVGDTTIELMNADGSAKHPLFHKDGVSAFDAVWSPAGDMIAFCVGRYFRAAGIALRPNRVDEARRFRIP